MQIFLLIFIGGLRRPYGKGLVGHCTSGHSLNPPLSTTGITVNSKRSVLSEQKSTESHLCMTTYSLSYNQIFLWWFAITNVLATFNCCKLHFSTFSKRDMTNAFNHAFSRKFHKMRTFSQKVRFRYFSAQPKRSRKFLQASRKHYTNNLASDLLTGC